MYFRSQGLSKFATEEETETLPVNTNIVFQLLQFSFYTEPTLSLELIDDDSDQVLTHSIKFEH